MYKKNTLNNIILGNKRKDPVYQAVLTDLALAGAIDIKIAEALLGYKIPDYLKLPADFDQKLATAMEEAESIDVEEEEAEPVDEETPTSDSSQDEPVDEDSANEQSVDSEVADDEARH